MNKSSQVATLWVISGVLWLGSLVALVYFAMPVLEIPVLALPVGLLLAAAGVSLLALNRSQHHAEEASREVSRIKRTLQESHLKIERFEYEGKQSAELRRLVLSSAQEKDLALKNMANALNTAMAEVQSLCTSSQPDALERIREKSELMQRYADDLKVLARLELKSELPRTEKINLLTVLEGFCEEWLRYGKEYHTRVRFEHQEDQLPLVSDVNWLHSLLTRVVYSLMRMNEGGLVQVHLIGYIDAELGEALRIRVSAEGRHLEPDQLSNVLTHYTSVIDKGRDVGPGLSLVVGRRLAQMLGGNLDVLDGDKGTEVLVVLPRKQNNWQETDVFG
ncbi:sensor histidine kinase [Saccharospirillum sp.]|uniref:sensor histidine kinase n=1 Tax=Saccharospirillum sp. TaxID=2033801 RepID=UPI0034A02A0A